eukprot:scaffold8456_cov210-Pinguiococcus_pyrenoidosus.AAC.2
MLAVCIALRPGVTGGAQLLLQLAGSLLSGRVCRYLHGALRVGMPWDGRLASHGAAGDDGTRLRFPGGSVFPAERLQPVPPGFRFHLPLHLGGAELRRGLVRALALRSSDVGELGILPGPGALDATVEIAKLRLKLRSKRLRSQRLYEGDLLDLGVLVRCPQSRVRDGVPAPFAGLQQTLLHPGHDFFRSARACSLGVLLLLRSQSAPRCSRCRPPSAHCGGLPVPFVQARFHLCWRPPLVSIWTAQLVVKGP